MNKVKMNGLFNVNTPNIEKRLVYQDTIDGRHFVITHTKYKLPLDVSCYMDTFINGYHCGYIEVTKEELDSYDYDNEDSDKIDCHGGITFSGEGDFGKYYIGFDCNHWADTIEECSVDYCIKQCKSIIK
jgi:hypothetical protein